MQNSYNLIVYTKTIYSPLFLKIYTIEASSLYLFSFLTIDTIVSRLNVVFFYCFRAQILVFA